MMDKGGSHIVTAKGVIKVLGVKAVKSSSQIEAMDSQAQRCLALPMLSTYILEIEFTNWIS